MLEIILIIATLLGGVAAAGWAWERIGKLFKDRLSSSKADTPIFFNNGWDGFSTEDESDILFRLALKGDLSLVQYIVIGREFKPEMFTTRVPGLLAVPESSPDPYQRGAFLEMLVGSVPSEEQSSEDYDRYFEHYAPIFPDDVYVDNCDGGSQAEWIWRCKIPDQWLQESSPFVKSEAKVKIKTLLESWISAHNDAISRIHVQQAVEISPNKSLNQTGAKCAPPG